jgi:hypothetical protein
MLYARNDRIFCIPAKDIHDLAQEIGGFGYGGWSLKYLESMGHFIELADSADDKLRALLKKRYARK